MTYEYWSEVIKGERLPTVVVDLDAFDRNLKKVAQITRGIDSNKKQRIATKSIRVPALLKRVLDSGSPFQGLLCFSAEEALALAAQGFDDFLIAYPTVQITDLQALRHLHENGSKVALVVDSPQGVEALSQALGKQASPFRIVLDLDVSLRLFGGLVHLGVRRSPLRSDEDILKMFLLVKSFSNLKIVGAMAYEAQVAGLGDRNPFKKILNPIAHWIRKVSMKKIVKRRLEVAELFKKNDVSLEIFNGGGTGSLNFAATESSLTELTAGSALLCSHLFDYFSNIHFEPACFFALQVTRHSDNGFATCLGGGYVASGDPGWQKLPIPFLPQGLKLVEMEGAGEVQTPLIMPSGVSLRLGSPVFFRHAKAGELAERFNEYLLVSNGKIVDRVKTYRGLGLSFF